MRHSSRVLMRDTPVQSRLTGLRARQSELESELTAQREHLLDAERYCGDMAVAMEESKRQLVAKGACKMLR